MNVWPYNDFPHSVVLDGIEYLRAEWACDICYADVIAQYRENRPYNSGHLFVYDDKSWIVDHIDKYNPDRGHVFQHGLVDVFPKVAAPLLLIVGVVALGVTISRKL